MFQPSAWRDQTSNNMGLFDFITRLFSKRRPPQRPSAWSPSINVPPPRTATGGFVQTASNDGNGTAASTRAPVGPPPVKTLNLDASQFAPISSQDALAAS